MSGYFYYDYLKEKLCKRERERDNHSAFHENNISVAATLYQCQVKDMGKIKRKKKIQKN